MNLGGAWKQRTGRANSADKWDAGGQGRRGTSGSGPGESEAVSAVASVAVHVGPGAWAPGSAVPVRALADGPGDLGARALAC